MCLVLDKSQMPMEHSGEHVQLSAGSNDFEAWKGLVKHTENGSSVAGGGSHADCAPVQ